MLKRYAALALFQAGKLSAGAATERVTSLMLIVADTSALVAVATCDGLHSKTLVVLFQADKRV